MVVVRVVLVVVFLVLEELSFLVVLALELFLFFVVVLSVMGGRSRRVTAVVVEKTGCEGESKLFVLLLLVSMSST